MSDATATTVDAIRRELESRDDVVTAYVFGSVARGSAEPHDIDVAVVFATGFDPFRHALEVQVALERAVDQPVDVHGFEVLPVDVRFRVVREGTVVVDRDPAQRVRREVATMFAYDDFVPYLDTIREGARRRLAAGARRG